MLWSSICLLDVPRTLYHLPETPNYAENEAVGSIRFHNHTKLFYSGHAVYLEAARKAARDRASINSNCSSGSTSPTQHQSFTKPKGLKKKPAQKLTIASLNQSDQIPPIATKLTKISNKFGKNVRLSDPAPDTKQSNHSGASKSGFKLEVMGKKSTNNTGQEHDSKLDVDAKQSVVIGGAKIDSESQKPKVGGAGVKSTTKPNK